MQVESLLQCQDTQNHSESHPQQCKKKIKEERRKKQETLTFERIVIAMNKCQRTQIRDSLGCSYSIQKRTSHTVYWQCITRVKDSRCPATVIEKDGQLKSGHYAHCDSCITAKPKVQSKPNPDKITLHLEQPKVPRQPSPPAVLKDQKREKAKNTLQKRRDGVTFKLIYCSSKRRKERLIDSLGYSYMVKQRYPHAIFWECSVRINSSKCPAFVIERNGQFKHRSFDHIHLPKSKRLKKFRTEFTEHTKEANRNDSQSFSIPMQDVCVAHTDNSKAPNPEASSIESQETTTKHTSQTEVFRSPVAQPSPPATPQDQSDLEVNDALQNAQGGVTFKFISASSENCKDKVIDSLGYTYRVRKRKPYAVYWKCSVRQKESCPASLIEKHGYFRHLKSDHNHPPKIKKTKRTKTPSVVHEEEANADESFATVLGNFLTEHINEEMPNLNVPNEASPPAKPVHQTEKVMDSPPVERVGLTVQFTTTAFRRYKEIIKDSLGHPYKIKDRTPFAIYWECCAVRQQGNGCPATVIERNGQFTHGINYHIHPPKISIPRKLKILDSTELAEEIESVATFGQAALLDHIDERMLNIEMPRVANLRAESKPTPQLEKADVPRTSPSLPAEPRYTQKAVMEGEGEEYSPNEDESELNGSTDSEKRKEDILYNKGHFGTSKLRKSDTSSRVSFAHKNNLECVAMVAEKDRHIQPEKDDDHIPKGKTVFRPLKTFTKNLLADSRSELKEVEMERLPSSSPASPESTINENLEASSSDDIVDDLIFQKDAVASKRYKNKLVDSLGYSYTLKRSTERTSYWECSVSHKSVRCLASVIETNGHFERGKHRHIHKPKLCV